MKVTKSIVESYARHLATSVALAVIAISNVVHSNPIKFTKGDWVLVANALWISVLPQIRNYVALKDPTLSPVVEYVAGEVASGVAEVAPVASDVVPAI